MNNNKRFFRNYIVHDLKNGILSEWKKYVFLVVFVVLWCMRIRLGKRSIELLYSAQIGLSAGDYLLLIFRGMPVIHLSLDNIFIPDINWIILYLYLAFIVSYYPTKDLHGFGQFMLIRSKKRKYWWMSKCLWNVASVVLYHISIFITVMLFSIFAGDFSWDIQPNVLLYFGLDITNLNIFSTIGLFFVIPLVTSISVSLLQMAVSVIINPVMGVILVMVMYISSIYYCAFWLLGNYLMPVRNRALDPLEGIGSFNGIVLNGILLSLAVFAGYFCFSKKDIR